MQLFDEFHRTDATPAGYSESHFTFLNRSARPDVLRIRAQLEEWFTRYPVEHKRDLLGGLRSSEDWQHEAALFELILHELLVSTGASVELHPEVAGTSKRPDFKVTFPGEPAFYLEATVATDSSAGERAAKARERAVYDVLNRLDISDFSFWVDVPSAPARPPSARRIGGFLTAKVRGLDPDAVAAAYADGRPVPVWQFEEDGWVIQFQPIPRKAEARGRQGARAVGVLTSGGVRVIDSRTAVRDAVLEKAGRYGELGAPFIVAVNSTGEWPPEDIDVTDALFGQETMRVTASGKLIGTRMRNGAWVSGTGPQWTRNSGVLVTSQLAPWTLHSAPVWLYHNPWAAVPYRGRLCDLLPQAVIALNGQPQFLPGRSIGEILGVPDGWPR